MRNTIAPGSFRLLIVIAGLIQISYAFTTIPDPRVDEPKSQMSHNETAVLAAGCFWGTQAIYLHTAGVISVTAGYSGGTSETARYQLVSTGTTNHAESVQIIYDPSQVSYGQLLKIFFSVAHDPTQLDRQNADIGKQYRSAIFYTNNQQKRVAEAYMAQINAAKVFPSLLVTKLGPLTAFYPAEPEHQNYVALHPDDDYVVKNELPKIGQFHQSFSELWVESSKLTSPTANTPPKAGPVGHEAKK